MRNGSSRKGSFRLGLGKKDHTVIELGSIDTQRLLLNGGEMKEKYQPPTNSLSSRQMKSLTALCDTILPSLDDFVDVSDDSVANFYRISASMAGTPERVWLACLLTSISFIFPFKISHIIIISQLKPSFDCFYQVSSSYVCVFLHLCMQIF